MKVKNTMASQKKSLEKTRGRLQEVFGGDYSNFTCYASTPEHLSITGNDSRVLGYRVRFDANILGEWATSSAQLPPLPMTSSKRGEFEERHYVVCTDYTNNSVPFVSLEYKRDDKKRWSCQCLDGPK